MAKHNIIEIMFFLYSYLPKVIMCYMFWDIDKLDLKWFISWLQQYSIFLYFQYYPQFWMAFFSVHGFVCLYFVADILYDIMSKNQIYSKFCKRQMCTVKCILTSPLMHRSHICFMLLLAFATILCNLHLSKILSSYYLQ